MYWVNVRSRASVQRAFRESILAKRCDIFLSLGDSGEEDDDMGMNQLAFTKPHMSLAYVLAVQGTPLLAWLFVFFFGLSIVGVEVSPWIAAAASYSIYAGAFLGEIWRGALQAIPRQQWEAGSSLGLSFTQQLRYIIVPQATRLAIPPTVGFLVQLIKNTSLAAVIGFVELTREGQLTTATTFRPFTVYLTVAALYFLLCFPLTQASRRLERRLHAR